MSSLTTALKSQVGRKVLTGITGIGLVIFVILHLIGNLKLFGSVHAFNLYTYDLESLGWILYVLEVLLAICFLLHAYIGISIWLRRKRVRPKGYDKYQTMGDPSHQNWASRSMIFTGILLLAFLVWHLITFKFGATATTTVDGTQMRDLKQLVIQTFQNPWYAFSYTFIMILLGLHLSHGFWSAFTSLSMRHKKFSSVIYGIGIVIALLLAVGFLFIPMYIYLAGSNGALIAM